MREAPRIEEEDRSPPIRCSSVEVSASMVRKLAGSTIEIAVPRVQIRHMALTYDTSARYPFLRFFLGFVLLAIGGLGVIVLVLASFRGLLPISLDARGVSVELAPTALWLMLGLGVWLLAGVFRASYHLVVHTDGGIVKMPLGSSTQVADVRQFVRRAAWTFGYEIDASILEKTHVAP